MLSLSRAGNLGVWTPMAHRTVPYWEVPKGPRTREWDRTYPESSTEGQHQAELGERARVRGGTRGSPVCGVTLLGPQHLCKWDSPHENEGGWGREDIPEHNLVWSDTQLSWIPTVSLFIV